MAQSARFNRPIPLELLAPARNAEVGCDAIDHGADAVYIGAPRFGARAAAGNSVDDIARLANYAHRFGARVYATVNTIVYDSELRDVERLVAQLYRAGVDALIVQDLGLLRLDLPPIALHASTQCDLRTPQKARFLDALGFSQLVLARELTLHEIADIAAATTLPLEAFVHGALCVCYSGRCQAGQALMGRSANRGECPQICRLRYNLLDAETGRTLLSDKHLLSLRDLNQSTRLQQLINAGVRSFKIEGRLKDAAYVRNVTAYYREKLDRIIAASDTQYVRASYGTTTLSFRPDLTKTFNREFTHYFLDSRGQPQRMANFLTPKSMGEPLGRAIACKGNTLHINTEKPLANGDGLSYVTADGLYAGVRVNRVVRQGVVELYRPARIDAGTMLRRTADKAMTDALSHPSAQRTIALSATLRQVDSHRLALTVTDETGRSATVTASVDTLVSARTPQQQRQCDELAKLGDTEYRLHHADVLGHLFVPVSVLADMRRRAVTLLTTARLAAYIRPRRRPENLQAPWTEGPLLSADNVANALSEQLYRDHGAELQNYAIEIADTPVPDGTAVMTTRYCLRRELGACMQTATARRLPPRLLLQSGPVTLAVECDCARCEMTLRICRSPRQQSASGK